MTMTRLSTASTVQRAAAPASQQEQGGVLPSVTPSAAQQHGVASPSPAGRVATEDEGQRHVGGGESLLDPSDNVPAGTTVTSRPKVLMERGEVTDVAAPPTKEETLGAGARVTLDSHLDVRVTREEHDAIKRRATVLGVKPSTWARAVMRDALDERRHEVEALAAQAAMPRPAPELAQAVEQVRRVGVNLNQVVRSGTAVDEDILREVLAALAEVRSLLGDEVSL
ncbi:hypothetical protein QEV68_05425 [Trueperella pyogenes]|uniref:plasmid mobilization protein n=1 Tax=Trueperella pyogenes TaxID=1661 RepID=UPI00324A3980